MIEVINKKTDFSGWIDGDKYLNKHMQVFGYLEGNEYKWKGGETLLILKLDGKILFQDDDFAGTLNNGKIYDNHGFLIYSFHKKEKQIRDKDDAIALELDGDLINIGEREFFGIVSHFLELFA